MGHLPHVRGELHFYFVNRRRDLPPTSGASASPPRRRRYRWDEFDERFDARAHPNEPNRFGWVVEIDPLDPHAVPVKRTALGRMRPRGRGVRGGAGRPRWPSTWATTRVRVRLQVRHAASLRSGPPREANRDLLDDGTLYVGALRSPTARGDWLPLVHGQRPADRGRGFADQGAVLVRTRQAADALGATRMDRPEWIVPHPVTREVYCACTGNAARGRDGNEGPTPANPRAPNPFGHLLRWRDDGGDPAATRFRWDVFVQAGPVAEKGTIKGDRFACPDGLWIDSRGTLWVQTDVSPTTSARATSRRSATIRCWPSTRRWACSSAFSPGPADARSRAFTRRPTTARRS